VTAASSKAASVGKLLNINAPCDLTIIVGRAFTERSRGGRCSGYVRGPDSPSSGAPPFAYFNLCVVNLSCPQLVEPNQSELLTIPECGNGAAITGSRPWKT
jgi:hypothetical protein